MERDAPSPCRPQPVVAVQRRDLCVWLAALASWRGGLIGRLAGTSGGVEVLLRRDPASIQAAVAGSRAGRRAGQSREEEERFAAALAAGPAGFAARAQRGEGTAVVTWWDPLYPARMKQLADPPPALFVRASCSSTDLRRRVQRLGEAPCVAVVGARAPSRYGAEMAALLGRDLAGKGFVVVSGMAVGIDAAAQRGALAGAREEVPCTVGVLGCGADVVYPRTNEGLFGDVAASGLLVSEFCWGVRARAWRFPARNRVMAAVARAVVIVEGASRSGARITVDDALDLGREVLAVPGEAGRRLTAAPHSFLRDGAAICESADDVARVLHMELPQDPPADVLPTWREALARLATGSSDRLLLAAVLEAVDAGAKTVDQAALRSGLAARQVVALLSRLEVEGLVELGAGGAYRPRRV